MQTAPEISLILISVFAIVFLATLFIEIRIERRRVLDSTYESVSRVGRFIDWLIIIAVTSLLVYLIK